MQPSDDLVIGEAIADHVLVMRSIGPPLLDRHSNGLRLVGVGVVLTSLLACGSDTQTGSGGAGGTTSSGGAGGSATSMHSGRSGAGGLLGLGGAAPTCPAFYESASVVFDGQDASSAMVESLWIAPAASLGLCFAMPGDEFVACTSWLEIVPFGSAAPSQPVEATVMGTYYDAAITDEPGFTITFNEPSGEVQGGVFGGTVSDGTTSYSVTGSFSACPQVTE
jgi:hypothetical protein